MRRAHRRSAVHERRYGLPAAPLVREGVGRDRNLKTLVRLQREAEQMSSKQVGSAALIGRDIKARKRFTDVFVGNDGARRIEPSLAAVDRSRPLWVPGDALMAHVLHAHRPPEMF